jgi:hypothetical protein
MLYSLLGIGPIRGFNLIREDRPLLGIGAKTVWDHWRQFKKFGLDYGVTGRPRLLSEAHMDVAVDFALAEFHALPQPHATDFYRLSLPSFILTHPR